jgi:hypothetical protein
MKFVGFTMSKMAKTVSVVGFVLIMIVVSRLLYLLASRDSQGLSQAGTYGLWRTVGAVVIACIAGGLMFYLFLDHDRDKSSKTNRVPLEPATASARLDLTVKSTTPEPFDITRWEQLNPWLIEGQADDRMPMLGSAGDGNGSLSGRRSTSRRTHQMMYKKWSQARHI